MNLAEVMAGAVVLATAGSGSLQIWAASAGAHHTLEQRQELLVQLDGALLAAEARLRLPLQDTPTDNCAAAVAAMAEQLEAAPLPEGLQRQLELQPTGLWLRLQAEPLPPRQRWLDAAALGHCAASEPTPTAPADGPSDDIPDFAV